MKDSERREYSRIDAYLPLGTRLVSPDERERLRAHSSKESAGIDYRLLAEPEEKGLPEALKVINAKLDVILNLLTFHGGNLCTLQPSYVNISGSGLSFDTMERYELGDVVELKLIFPSEPDVVYAIYGEVMKSKENERCGGRRISVRYTVIDEEMRDKIVKFVFDKEREVLRKLRRQ